LRRDSAFSLRPRPPAIAFTINHASPAGEIQH
jgi:hypothetical protein